MSTIARTGNPDTRIDSHLDVVYVLPQLVTVSSSAEHAIEIYSKGISSSKSIAMINEGEVRFRC
jgi:hypothetical protein